MIPLFLLYNSYVMFIIIRNKERVLDLIVTQAISLSSIFCGVKRRKGRGSGADAKYMHAG